MKYLSLFSGIGAFEKALDRLGINYELAGFSEIDKYAVKSYCAIHGVDESMNLGDITKIDETALPKDIDLITYGFPCQDISLAGKQKGLFNEDGTQTRSGLFFEALRIIEAAQPAIAIAENVKNLTSKKFSQQFRIVLDSLEAAGYNNYWQVLNAKDFGIPQNRERVFIVSIRKDIDTGAFKFPEGFPLELRLKDVLETEVSEQFYVSDIALKGFAEHARKQQEKGNSFHAVVKEPDEIASTIKARYYKDGSDCLIRVKEATKTGYAEAFEGDSINLEQPNSKTRRGRVGHGVARTLTTSPQQAVVENVQGTPLKFLGRNQKNIEGDYAFCADTAQTGGVKEEYTDGSLRIRRLTPKECFRLMDFDDADFEKAEAVNSNTQLYKQAGNSIVVAVAYHVIKALIEANIFIEKEKKEMEIRMNEYQLPAPISFNYEELKQEIESKVSMYTTLVYTDEQIQEAKKDKAALNKLKTALNDERIRMEKEYMVPFNTFKAQINEIIGIIDKPVKLIDQQVKGYEEKQKAEKLEKIQEYYNSVEKPELQWLGFPAIYNVKWLNASVSMKSIQAEIDAKLEQIENDLATLQNLPEFGFEAQQVYISTLDMNKAIAEGHRMSEIARAKAEREAAMRKIEEEQKAKAQAAEAEQIPGQVEFTDSKSFDAIAEEAKPARQWVRFQAFMTTEDALALKDFFNRRNIEFKAV